MKDSKSSSQEPIKVFVVMPFGTNDEYKGGAKESKFVYENIILKGIERAASFLGLEIKTHLESNSSAPGSITKSIIENLSKADIVIGDLTGRNPNVFLELGIRFSLRIKGTLLITQSAKDVPFDITHYRYILYNTFESEESIERIAKYIEKVIKDGTHKSDSIVHDFIPQLFINYPGMPADQTLLNQTLVTGGNLFRTITWTEINDRSEKFADILARSVRDGKFTPDAIIGISNGGYIIAEIIGRRLSYSKPILGLWANRGGSQYIKHPFFDNIYNAHLCNSIKEAAGNSDEPINIILLDDHIGYGTTAAQAISYLKEKLGENVQILFIPVISGRPEEALIGLDSHLPYSFSINGIKIFTITKDEFINIIKTDAKLFPYLDKEIRQGV